MIKNHDQGRANEAKGKTTKTAGRSTGDRNPELKGKSEKAGDKAETKTGSMKNDAKRTPR